MRAATTTKREKRAPREIRKESGLSLMEAAVHADSAAGTIRLYEANPDAVSEDKRVHLDAYYAGLAAALADERKVG